MFKITLFITLLTIGVFTMSDSTKAQQSSQPAQASEYSEKDKDYWKEVLDPETYSITREGGTERPFTGKYYHHKEDGVYKCSNCGLELFSSEEKYDSGSGWPSFKDAVNLENVKLKKDTSHGMVRTEILCARCGAHLGHVFEDGPGPTGLRYCVNSASLKHENDEKEESKNSKDASKEEK